MTGSGRISNETRDKATFQLVSKISGAKEDQHDLLKETALTIGKILSYCNKNTEDLNSMAVRDEVMLPKLAAINDLYVPPGLVTNSTTFCHALFIRDHCKTKKGALSTYSIFKEGC